MSQRSTSTETVSNARQEAVRVGLTCASKLLPDQAPLRAFVSQNMLPAFQNMHFHDAVRRAREVFGAEPYWSEARFREGLKSGRITQEDLKAALVDQFPTSHAEPAEELLGDRALQLLLLEFEVPEETNSTLRWRIEERNLLSQLRTDLPAKARTRILEETFAWLKRTLESTPDGAIRFGQLVTGASSPDDVRESLENTFATGCDPEDLLSALEEDTENFCAHALWSACRLQATGYTNSVDARSERLPLHRDAIRDLTGEDVFDQVFPSLIRLTAAYLDEGVAYWPMPDRDLGFYVSTRRLVAEGSLLLTPWLEDVRRAFRSQLERKLSAMDAVLELLEQLGVPQERTASYIESLLTTLPGWAGLMSRLERHPDDRPPGSAPASLLDFLAVRLTYEHAALRDVLDRNLCSDSLKSVWSRAIHAAAAAPADGIPPAYRLFQLAQLAGLSAPMIRRLSRASAHDLLLRMDSFDELKRRRVFQEAFERHHRVQVLDTLAVYRDASRLHRPDERPRFQVVCCFDEREESFRRHLEEIAPDCETYGAPGFFGAAIRFRGIDEPGHVALAPLMVTPTHLIEERPRLDDARLHSARLKRRRHWGRLLFGTHTGTRSLWRGLVLNAAFGILAAFPLTLRVLSPRTAGRLKRKLSELFLPSPRTELTVHHEDTSDLPPGVAQRGFSTDERVLRVATVLENIGLREPMAKLVLVLGHGSTTLNNPHKSAYDCGACGGHQGGPNARVFCHMANDPDVRAALKERGIVIPQDTWFIGGQHDTCNDMVTFLDDDGIPETHKELFRRVAAQIKEAGARNAQERCRRLFSAPKNPTPERAFRHVEDRSEHLAEPRPEFSHCTNSLAVIGRRALTRGLFMDRRAFLLSYDPTIDTDGRVLERTLAAAVPVGAGINLTYYFCTVDSEHYGAGSKLAHNVTGLLGVMSGHASDLRTGLPRQAVEIHEPMRLLVIVEATPQRLLELAGCQAELNELVVNRWVQLVSLHPETGEIQIFTDRGFEPYTPTPVKLREALTSWEFSKGHTEPLAFGRIGQAM